MPMASISVLRGVDFFKSEDKCPELGAGDRVMGPYLSHSLLWTKKK